MTDKLQTEIETEPLTESGVVIDLRDGARTLLDPTTASPLEVPFVDVGLEYARSRSAIDTAIQDVIDSGAFVLGSAVSAFEQAFAAFCGVDHAIGVDSGYSALEMIVRGYGIGPGDEVITAANTFVATVAAIEATGATARLVDIDPKTHNLDPNAFESAITRSTRAVIPVHLYGQPADMSAIRSIAGSHGLRIIEDACQAHGATYRGKRAGSLGDAAAFSFYPSKNLGAFGDGGIVVTDDAELAERIRLLRNVGSNKKYHHEIKGFNRRLDSLHAAVLSVKLANLDSNNESRAVTASLYDEMLADLPLATPWVSPDGSHVYHLYVIETEHRDALQAFLAGRHIATGIHYPVPIHLQEAYQNLGYRLGDFPLTEEMTQRILSLPIYPHMPIEFVAHVAASVKQFFQSEGV